MDNECDNKAGKIWRPVNVKYLSLNTHKKTFLLFASFSQDHIIWLKESISFVAYALIVTHCSQSRPRRLCFAWGKKKRRKGRLGRETERTATTTAVYRPSLSSVLKGSVTEAVNRLWALSLFLCHQQSHQCCWALLWSKSSQRGLIGFLFQGAFCVSSIGTR